MLTGLLGSASSHGRLWALSIHIPSLPTAHVHTCMHAYTCAHMKAHTEDTPVKDGAHASTVGTAPVHVQPGGQENAVLHGDRAVGEGGDQKLVPPCGTRGGREGQSRFMEITRGQSRIGSPGR